MARTKIQDLRNLSIDELNAKLKELRKELFNYQEQSIMGTLEKPHNINLIKKDIARILTILKNTELKNAK